MQKLKSTLNRGQREYMNLPSKWAKSKKRKRKRFYVQREDLDPGIRNAMLTVKGTPKRSRVEIKKRANGRVSGSRPELKN